MSARRPFLSGSVYGMASIATSAVNFALLPVYVAVLTHPPRKRGRIAVTISPTFHRSVVPLPGTVWSTSPANMSTQKRRPDLMSQTGPSPCQASSDPSGCQVIRDSPSRSELAIAHDGESSNAISEPHAVVPAHPHQPRRILILSPWHRPLAHVYGAELRSLGHEVLVVTTTRHPDKTSGLIHEIMWDKPTFPRSATGAWALRRTVAAFGPDIAFEDIVDDPTWLGLATRTPRVVMIHDAVPHDAANAKVAVKNAAGRYQFRRSDAVLTYSRYIADLISTTGYRGRRLSSQQRIFQVPLLSDVPDTKRLPAKLGNERRDFLIIGQVSDYKGLDLALAAWSQVKDAGAFPGEVLRVITSRSIQSIHRKDVEVISGEYDYIDLLPTLPNYRALLLPYRVASQSGVQVLALQNGVVPIVSDVGALPEYQPPGMPPIAVGDVDGLCDRMLRLRSQDTCRNLGAASRAFYESTCGTKVVGPILQSILDSVTDV